MYRLCTLAVGVGGNSMRRHRCGNSPETVDPRCSLLTSFCGLDLLKRRLVDPHTTVIIPLDDRVIFVSLLNCAEFSTRLSEVPQTLDPISGSQFLARGRGPR